MITVIRTRILIFILMVVALISSLSLADTSSPTSNPQHNQHLLNTDIRVFIELVAKATGARFVLDPEVRGEVSVVLPANVPEKKLKELFFTVLNIHGYATVKIGDSIKIAPATSIKPLETFLLDDLHDGNNTVLSERVTELIVIDHVSADTLITLLEPVVPEGAFLSSVSTSNAILVADTREHINKLRALIAVLDTTNPQIPKLFNLQYVNAADVQAMLNEYLTNIEDLGTTAKPLIVVDGRANSILIAASDAVLRQAGRLIDQLDVAGREAEPVITKAVYLQFGDAERLQGMLTTLLEDSAKDNLLVVADTAINALILKGTRQQIHQAEQAISQLDVRQAQVLVEVIVAEISSTTAAEIGVQWALSQGDFNALTSFNGSGANLIELRDNPAAIGNGFSLGLGSFTNKALNVGALIRALAKDANTNIISTPSLLTLDNQPAKIVVGQNVPFVTGQYAQSGDGGSASSPFQTIKRQDVGLTLNIKPKISASGAIRLDIEQEISSVSAQSNQATDIVTNKRAIKTQVIAGHRDLVILGGLIDDNLQETAEKVPLLGDLPIVGQAFKYRRSSLVKRNLMVFIRPTIVMDDAILNQETHAKYEAIRQLQLQVQGNDLLEHAQVSLPTLVNNAEQQVLKEAVIQKAREQEKNNQSPDW